MQGKEAGGEVFRLATVHQDMHEVTLRLLEHKAMPDMLTLQAYTGHTWEPR